MKILHITDIHSDFERLKNVVESESFDLILISGDITHFGNKAELQKALDILDSTKIDYFAVTGNCDKLDCEYLLEDKGISLDSKIINFDDYQLCGLSGSLPCPGATPNEFTEDEFAAKLATIEKSIIPGKPAVFVTHQPPHNTINDKIITGLHAGSKTVRDFIEKHSPVICLTGHIHEGKGTDYIGKCPVINPGPLRNGHFAIVDITGESTPYVDLY